ncbi:MAG: IS4 family transposase [Gammaproteobacteria bacterium]
MDVSSDENWHVLLSLFPENWRELAKNTKAMVRKFRNFSCEEKLMRTLLLHIACGYSLRETTVRAKASNIADVSDVALLKRLKLSENWFKALSFSLLEERGPVEKIKVKKNICMKLVDATIVKEPGKTGSSWRIHYSLKLPELNCDYFKLTGVKGQGTGESFKQFPIQNNDCIIGDRGYSTAQGIAYVASQGAYSLVRINTNAVNFYSKDLQSFNLLDNINAVNTVFLMKSWDVLVKSADGHHITGRLCVIRKTEAAIAQALKRLKREASKRQSELKPGTIEYAKYIIVFTTLSVRDFSTKEVLDWYRLRWQIELVFKRLKSLAGLGHLPKYDEGSARAWLHAKLFVGLMIEKLIRYSSDFSP